MRYDAITTSNAQAMRHSWKSADSSKFVKAAAGARANSVRSIASSTRKYSFMPCTMPTDTQAANSACVALLMHLERIEMYSGISTVNLMGLAIHFESVRCMQQWRDD